MTNKTERQKRRTQVYQGILKGLKEHEISSELGYSLRTIKRDVKEVKKELEAEEMGKGQKGLYVEFSENSKMRIRRLWNILGDKSASSNDKIKAVNALREEDRQAVARAQIIGLLPKLIPDGEEGAYGQTINNQQVNIFQVLMSIKEREKRGELDGRREEIKLAGEERSKEKDA